MLIGREKIVQIIPTSQPMVARYRDKDREDSVHFLPIVCLALVEIDFAGLQETEYCVQPMVMGSDGIASFANPDDSCFDGIFVKRYNDGTDKAWIDDLDPRTWADQ